MSLLRHPENRPGLDPQMFSSRANADFSNAGDHLGKILSRSAGGKYLSGSNRRTVFRMANAPTKSPNHLLPNLKPDKNKIPLTQCPFFRSKPRGGTEKGSERIRTGCQMTNFQCSRTHPGV